MTTKKLLTAREATKYIGCARSTFFNAVKKGAIKIAHRQTDHGGRERFLFTKEDLDKYHHTSSHPRVNKKVSDTARRTGAIEAFKLLRNSSSDLFIRSSLCLQGSPSWQLHFLERARDAGAVSFHNDDGRRHYSAQDPEVLDSYLEDPEAMTELIWPGSAPQLGESVPQETLEKEPVADPEKIDVLLERTELLIKLNGALFERLDNIFEGIKALMKAWA